MIKKIIIFVFLSLFSISNAQAVDLWLKNIPLKNLQELYQQVGYTGIEEKNWLMIPSYKYPPIFLKNFPKEFYTLNDETERNSLFIKMLAPLCLKLNQDLLAERQTILDIEEAYDKSHSLSDKQINILEKKSEKYDIFTRLKDNNRYDYLISELINRIDIIPPSLMITLASIETDFGSSRIVKEGNSLYKMLQWHTKAGLKPIGENEDDSYRIKTYPDLYSSLKDFALKINSSPNFAFLRIARADARRHATTPRILGFNIATYAFTNSELRNYAGIIDYTLSYYELTIIDKSVLDNEAISNKVAKQYSKFTTKK